MTDIGILGSSTNEKEWFIYYIGKLLSAKNKVNIVSKHRSFLERLDNYEYSPQLIITRSKDLNFNGDYILYDMDTISEAVYDATIFYSGITKNEVTYNADLFSLCDAYSNKFYVINGILYESPINAKYLYERLGLTAGELKIETLMFNDINLSTMIENQYNDRIQIKNLSKPYQKMLSKVLQHMTHLSNKEIRQLFKVAYRSK